MPDLSGALLIESSEIHFSGESIAVWSKISHRHHVT